MTDAEDLPGSLLGAEYGHGAMTPRVTLLCSCKLSCILGHVSWRTAVDNTGTEPAVLYAGEGSFPCGHWHC